MFRPDGRSTAARASSDVPTSRTDVSVDFALPGRGAGTSIGPAATICGPSSAPDAISRRHSCSAFRSPPMSRIPVMPLATSRGSRTFFDHAGSAFIPATCVCMSHKPGMRNFPRPSNSTASLCAGRLRSAELPIHSITPPETTTVISCCCGPCGLTMVTWVIARGIVAGKVGADSRAAVGRGPGSGANANSVTQRQTAKPRGRYRTLAPLAASAPLRRYFEPFR